MDCSNSNAETVAGNSNVNTAPMSEGITDDGSNNSSYLTNVSKLLGDHSANSFLVHVDSSSESHDLEVEAHDDSSSSVHRLQSLSLLDKKITEDEESEDVWTELEKSSINLNSETMEEFSHATQNIAVSDSEFVTMDGDEIQEWIQNEEKERPPLLITNSVMSQSQSGEMDFTPDRDKSTLPEDFSATRYFQGRSSISGYLPPETYRTQPEFDKTFGNISLTGQLNQYEAKKNGKDSLSKSSTLQDSLRDESKLASSKKENLEEYRQSLVFNAINSSNGSLTSLTQFLSNPANECLSENSIIDCVLSYCNRRYEKENKLTRTYDPNMNKSSTGHKNSIALSPLKEINSVPDNSANLLNNCSIPQPAVLQKTFVKTPSINNQNQMNESFSSVQSEESTRSAPKSDSDRTFTCEDQNNAPRGSSPCVAVPSETFNESELYQEGFCKFQNSLNKRSKSCASAHDIGSLMSTPRKHLSNPHYVPSIIQPTIDYQQNFRNNIIQANARPGCSIPIVIQVNCACVSQAEGPANKLNTNGHTAATSTFVYDKGEKNEINSTTGRRRVQVSSETFVCRPSPIPEECNVSVTSRNPPGSGPSGKRESIVPQFANRPLGNFPATKKASVPSLMSDKDVLDWGSVAIKTAHPNRVCITNSENVSLLMKLRIQGEQSECFEMIFKDTGGSVSSHREATCILKPNCNKTLCLRFLSSVPGTFSGELLIKFNFIDVKDSAFKTRMPLRAIAIAERD